MIGRFRSLLKRQFGRWRMANKSFEQTIPFHQIATPGGPVTLPLVTTTLIAASGTRYTLPLIFDTGASVTTLRKDLYPMLGLADWNVGQEVETHTAGGDQPVKVYAYRATLEVLGKTIDSTVHLANLPHNPLYVGLLGRQDVFEQFGFGFWESSAELFVTVSP